MRMLVSVVFFAVLSVVMLPTSSAAPIPDQPEQRGCCSHHNGVCGCSAGHTTCCDGSTSPSCQCRADDGTAQSVPDVTETGDKPEALSGDRALGERCTKDCQCQSRECKGFKCVVRDYTAHPSLPQGKDCRFDGDCASCDCAAFKCR